MKSRKKGRRDKPFRPLVISCIRLPDPPKAQVVPKPYFPQPISDFMQSTLALAPRHAQKIRRKARRKHAKAMAKWEAEQAQMLAVQQSKEEAEAQAARKRKADEDLYEGVKKRARLGESNDQVNGRKKLKPKSRVPGEHRIFPELPNSAPEPRLGEMPAEFLRECFKYCDQYSRTCVALTNKTFASVIMHDATDNRRVSEAEKTEAAGNRSGRSAEQKQKDNEDKNKKGEQRAGFPDIRKRYQYDNDRKIVMEHLEDLFPSDHRYCFICRKYKPLNGGKVLSYKNCPKKSLMAEVDTPNTSTTTSGPSGLLSRRKVERAKPTPDEVIWTEGDWSVMTIGAIRSRTGEQETHYWCPKCTDKLNTLHLPYDAATPSERFATEGNPIGGTLEDGRVPREMKENRRDPRRIAPYDGWVATRLGWEIMERLGRWCVRDWGKRLLGLSQMCRVAATGEYIRILDEHYNLRRWRACTCDCAVPVPEFASWITERMPGVEKP